MPSHPKFLTTRADQVHPIQVKLAFLTDSGEARPSIIRSVDDDLVELRQLDGTTTTVQVHDTRRLVEVLEREDLCRASGHPFAMVNHRYGVLALATGPATPPSKLEVLIVSRLGDEGGVVELLSGSDEQPAWQVFAIQVDR